MAGVTQQVATFGSWQHPEEVTGREGPVEGDDARTRGNGSRQPLLHLARAIEAEIIPRLMLAYSTPAKCATVLDVESRTPGPQVIAEFATLLLTEDLIAPTLYVETLRARGASLETIYLHLLAPAARRLGELWDADLCGFTDVTAGLCRLHQLLHQLSPEFQDGGDAPEIGHRALLAAAPGEQHTFGLWIVEEFLSRAGWDVSCEPGASSADLAGIVRSGWFDLVGLSLGCDARLAALRSTIRAVRRASHNRRIGVMVGGAAFVRRPQLVEEVGADVMATHGGQAALRAASFLARPRLKSSSRGNAGEAS